MELPLSNNYRLTSDVCNIILERRIVRQEGKNVGKVYWSAIGFYPTIRQALKSYVEGRQRTSGVKGWSGMEKLTKRLYGQIQAISQSLGIQVVPKEKEK